VGYPLPVLNAGNKICNKRKYVELIEAKVVWWERIQKPIRQRVHCVQFMQLPPLVLLVGWVLQGLRLPKMRPYPFR
jgi:hypothetical protein